MVDDSPHSNCETFIHFDSYLHQTHRFDLLHRLNGCYLSIDVRIWDHLNGTSLEDIINFHPFTISWYIIEALGEKRVFRGENDISEVPNRCVWWNKFKFQYSIMFRNFLQICDKITVLRIKVQLIFFSVWSTIGNSSLNLPLTWPLVLKIWWNALIFTVIEFNLFTWKW